MQALRPDPVTFGVQINGEEYDNTTSSGITISLCTIVKLNVHVSNQSDEPHGPLVLAIEPYQDQASGCPVTELDGKVAWVGTLQVHTPEVLPGKSFCHSCSLIFLYAGQFMVSISCTETATEQTATSQQGTGSESPERTCNSENTEKALKEEIHGLKRSWTYSPSVKIRVV